MFSITKSKYEKAHKKSLIKRIHLEHCVSISMAIVSDLLPKLNENDTNISFTTYPLDGRLKSCYINGKTLFASIEYPYVNRIIKACESWIECIFLTEHYTSWIDFELFKDPFHFTKLKTINITKCHTVKFINQCAYYLIKAAHKTLKKIECDCSIIPVLNVLCRSDVIFKKLTTVHSKSNSFAVIDNLELNQNHLKSIPSLRHIVSVEKRVPNYSTNENIIKVLSNNRYQLMIEHMHCTNHKYKSLVHLVLSLRQSRIFPKDIAKIIVKEVEAIDNHAWMPCVTNKEFGIAEDVRYISIANPLITRYHDEKKKMQKRDLMIKSLESDISRYENKFKECKDALNKIQAEKRQFDVTVDELYKEIVVIDNKRKRIEI